MIDLVHRTLELVKIPSVTKQEAEICDFLQRRLSEQQTFEVTRIDNNLIVAPKTPSKKQTVAFFGHLDTVPPTADNPPRIDGDRLYGLGVSDMKSGVALMWQLIEAPPKDASYDQIFVFYSGEEGPFDGSGLGPVLEQCSFLQERIDLAICLEPSDNILQLGCLGTLHAEVTFKGQAAHSARPWQGNNAIHQAGALLTRLSQTAPIDVRFGELSYREVISATLATGGRARNVVPDSFSVNLNYRFAPGRSLEQAQLYVREFVGEGPEVRFIDLSPSGAIPEDNAVLDAFRQVYGAAEAPKQAWTDVARLAQAGIAAINFGSGQSDQAHQPGEYASIPHLVAGEALIRRFLSA